jgi:ABC-type antimicrobial peptide transport system permease subunit
MFVYEAVSLILASGLLGTIIGMVVAATLTLQMLMFIELSFVFTFPTVMFLVTFIGGFLTAIGGSYFAIRSISDKSISSILKGIL